MGRRPAGGAEGGPFASLTRYRRRTVGGTVGCVATNLRLRPEAEEALRAEAERSQRSQQDILREAVDRYLGLSDGGDPVDDLIARGRVRPPRSAYRRVVPDPTTAGDGPSTAELLGRDDRF